MSGAGVRHNWNFHRTCVEQPSTRYEFLLFGNCVSDDAFNREQMKLNWNVANGRLIQNRQPVCVIRIYSADMLSNTWNMTNNGIINFEKWIKKKKTFRCECNPPSTQSVMRNETNFHIAPGICFPAFGGRAYVTLMTPHSERKLEQTKYHRMNWENCLGYRCVVINLKTFSLIHVASKIELK